MSKGVEWPQAILAGDFGNVQRSGAASVICLLLLLHSRLSPSLSWCLLATWNAMAEQLMVLPGADDSEKLAHLCSLSYKAQAVWFLNAFWDEIESESQKLWDYVHKCTCLAVGRRQGSGAGGGGGGAIVTRSVLCRRCRPRHPEAQGRLGARRAAGARVPRVL